MINNIAFIIEIFMLALAIVLTNINLIIIIKRQRDLRERIEKLERK